jgi:hypothetical protein
VTFGETVECLASEEFLGNLPLEVDAVGTVPGHGFHPLKARLSWSIPNPQDVHLLGRTPLSCPNFARFVGFHSLGDFPACGRAVERPSRDGSEIRVFECDECGHHLSQRDDLTAGQRSTAMPSCLRHIIVGAN